MGKGKAGNGFKRALVNSCAALVVMSREEVFNIGMLAGKNSTVLEILSPPVFEQNTQ